MTTPNPKMVTILNSTGLQSITVFVGSDDDLEKLKAHSGKHEDIRLDMMNGVQRITADGVVIWEGAL